PSGYACPRKTLRAGIVGLPVSMTSPSFRLQTNDKPACKVRQEFTFPLRPSRSAFEGVSIEGLNENFDHCFNDFARRRGFGRLYGAAGAYSLNACPRTGRRSSFARDRGAFHLRRVFELPSRRRRVGAIAKNTTGRGRGSDRAE